MDEDAPNFAHAYAGAESSSPSWNPALRPNHDNHENQASLAQQLQPSPQINPQSKPTLEDGQDDDEDEIEDDAPIMPTAEAASLEAGNKAPERDMEAVDYFSDRGQEAGHLQIEQTSEVDDLQQDDFDDDALAAAAEDLNLGDNMNEHTQEAEVEVVPDDHTTPEDQVIAREEVAPEQNYEHQGEATLLENARAEGEDMPLVGDTESTNDGWGASGDLFDLGGTSQVAPMETPLETPFQSVQPDAHGTTVGDDFIGDTTVGGNAGEPSDDWGNGGGDDFFAGTAVTHSLEPADAAVESPGAHVVKEQSGDKSIGTSDPMWDLDLDMDDDFLPDTEEAAPVFELDDDEGFLDDETPTMSQHPAPTLSTNKYAPTTTQTVQTPTTAYELPTPQLTNFAQPAQTPLGPAASAVYGAYGQSSSHIAAAARPQLQNAESFASKAREGYHSPYDLPEDIVTTRKRPAPRTTSVPAVQPSAPPRTSSMSGTGPSRSIPPTDLSRPSSGHSMQPQLAGIPPTAPIKPAAPPPGDFFAELPVVSKPRPSGRYTPQHGTPQPSPPGFAPKERTASWSSLRNEILPDSDKMIPQLQQPERLPVFPDQPTEPVRRDSLPVPQPAPAPPSNRYSPAPPSAPVPSARYSPAPPSAPSVPSAPPANARYSPAPPPSQGSTASSSGHYASPPLSGPPRPPSQNYAPRTSSPLAFHTLPQREEQQSQLQQHPTDESNSLSSDNIVRAAFKSPLEGVREEQFQPSTTAPPMSTRSETPPPRSGPSSEVSSPRKRSNYTPQYQSTNLSSPPGTLGDAAQSPPSNVKQSFRSFSNAGSVASAPGSVFAISHGISSAQNVNSIPPRRQPSLQYEGIAPTDERAADPLERWKGHPIFRWGPGGNVVMTFPKQIPRYGGGASAPMVKHSPGEIKIQSARETLALPEIATKFPGPLKAKSKKKDVSTWLAHRSEALEAQRQTPGLDRSLSADEVKRLEEKILLVRVLQVFIDNDGHLEGNAVVDAAVRKIFSPETDSFTNGDLSLTTAADLVGRPRSNTAGAHADPVDPKTVEELRNHLVKGDREKAVWHAVDQRLWAHAMLLSSTLNKDIWKQVVQEFVQKEVKKMGGNNQALAVLYEIFAGNHDDCIDELVPASARAGFQMMSTDGAGSTQNALEGLERWRETLSLVLNNRSDGDSAALVSLGKLLASYGRVEAAHICFIFARSQAHLNGVDDPEAHIVLIGADHKQHPLDLGIDLEPVLLTEVYEFGLSLSAQASSYIIPHLQNYKLAHAYQLAEYGHKAEAQAYCDAIAAAMKATTRVSPYYNSGFIAMLDDLSKRLSQSPKDGASSWISKPSMDKVSSSLLSKFNSFIAGDDEDPASSHSTGEAGPFGKIAGTPPALSPVQSSADLYGAYSGFGVPAAAPATNSRYAPATVSAPRTSIESTMSRYEPRGRASLDSRPSLDGRPSLDSNDGGAGMRAVSDSYMPSPQLSSSFVPSQPQLSPPVPSLSKAHSYSPLRSEYKEDSTPAFGGFQPLQASFDDTPSGESGFEPPSSSYQPNSYQPYQPEESEAPESSIKPKKSFMDMDDDDDLAARASALSIKGKSEADRQADEAFRKAAEEDAKRDKEAANKKSGGWFGGWFKKEDNAAAPKPIKAKLGEENSFRYDTELKKWVNTKAGAPETSKPVATPPPPRSGPPSRNVSSMSPMPPSSLPNGDGLAVPSPSLNPTIRSSSMPPPMGFPGSRASTPGIPSDNEGPKPPALVRPSLPGGPPSRPGTGMSTASSIDDLLGAPQARKGAGPKKKKSARYVDVMAKP